MSAGRDPLLEGPNPTQARSRPCGCPPCSRCSPSSPAPSRRHPPRPQTSAQPAPSPRAPPLLAIEAGGEHTCAIRFGALICWGSNEALQIGAPPSDSVERHNPPRRIIDAGVTAVAAGERHTCAIHGEGELICWGSNSDGQLGTPSREATAHTVFDSGVTALAVGASHTCAVHLSAVKCWGRQQQQPARIHLHLPRPADRAAR